MLCSVCKAEMKPLFFSAYCPKCGENPHTQESAYVGWIVWRSRPPGSCEYVFKTHDDCDRWRAAANLVQFPIRKVSSQQLFLWRKSTGSVPDIELADRLFEIFPDDSHGPGSNRAFLSPGDEVAMIKQIFSYDDCESDDGWLCATYHDITLNVDIGDLKVGHKFAFAYVDFYRGVVQFNNWNEDQTREKDVVMANLSLQVTPK